MLWKSKLWALFKTKTYTKAIKVNHYLILSFFLCFTICKAQETTYKSTHCCKRTVIILNDTILKYYEKIGSFSQTGTMQYKMDRDVFKVAGLSNQNLKSVFTLAIDLNGSILNVSKDSLVVVKTGEIFYEENYLLQKFEKEFLNFYLIIDEQKTLITFTNYKQIFINLNLENYTLIRLNKSRAKRKYGIDKNYKTFRLKQK